MEGTSRRGFLKLLAAGLVGHAVDVDKLLWVPGAKTIFLPSARQVYVHTLIMQHELFVHNPRMMGKISGLFDADDVFYNQIMHRGVEVISSRNMKIPLEYKK
jgi:hypothetical protein